ncbi:MAG: AI-2E family transporter [Planctomycetota bacterium]
MSRDPPEGNERRNVLLVLSGTVLAVLVLTYYLRSVFGPVLLALGLAYVLDPLVRKGTSFGFSRGMAVALVFSVFLATGGAGVWFLVNQGIELFHAAIGDPSDPLQKGFLIDLNQKVGDFLSAQFPSLPERVRDYVYQFDLERAYTVVATASDLLAEFGKGLSGLVNLISFFVLVPIYLYYLMLDLPKLFGWIQEHLPGRQRERLVKVAREIHLGLAAFLRGRLVIALIKGILTSIGLQIVGVDYAFLVGMLAGFLSILPFLGAALGLIGSAILVLVGPSAAIVGSLIGVIVVFTVAELIEGYVLYPLILGEKLDMHPVTMIVSILAWGSILGLFGILVAIPLTIIVKTLAEEYLLPPLEQLAREEKQPLSDNE